VRKYDNFEYDHVLIEQDILDSCEMIVIIPSYNEADLYNTLFSILDAEIPQNSSVEVIIVINDSSESPTEIKAFHKAQYFELLDWAKQMNNAKIRFYPLYQSDLPSQDAGVGLARKIAMDEAVKRFISIDKVSGVILSLDADVRIANNYFREIHKTYKENSKLRAANIYFEHDLNEALSSDALKAMIQYELHLRYHINMQRIMALPYAFQTVGSTMSVRASAYLAHFGMNKRQAGEDFYFLHKFIKTSYFMEINETAVYPSARFSDRVPFGTGKMVEKLSSGEISLKSYSYKSYEELAAFLDQLPSLFDNEIKDVEIPEAIKGFFGTSFIDRIDEIKRNTSSYKSFRKRFFQWFDAFRLIKYLHFMRNVENYESQAIEECSRHLIEKLGISSGQKPEEMLESLRAYDKTNPYNTNLLST